MVIPLTWLTTPGTRLTSVNYLRASPPRPYSANFALTPPQKNPKRLAPPPTSDLSDLRPLPPNARRVIDQEVARAAGGVVRIRHRPRGRTLGADVFAVHVMGAAWVAGGAVRAAMHAVPAAVEGTAWVRGVRRIAVTRRSVGMAISRKGRRHAISGR